MRSLDDLEDERLREQARLDSLCNFAERNQMGQFATPPRLADEIVGYCWNIWKDRSAPVRFLEPCLGTGSFFSSLLRVFARNLIQEATGFEIDPRCADVARHLWGSARLTVASMDFTEEDPPRIKYNLLIANPPYVRHHHLDRARKARLQTRVRDQLSMDLNGLAGLYCYFLLLSHDWLEEGGLSVWLIPSEFMDVRYGVTVKEYLTKRVKLLHVHRFCPTDVQFADALVSSAVVVFEKSLPSNHPVRFSLGGSLSVPEKTIALPYADLCPSSKWTKYTTSNSVEMHSEGRTVLFGDLFTIKRGLATGNNDFFILPRSEAQRRELPPECLRPILPSPRLLPEPVIEADQDGYPRLTPQLALLDCRLPDHLIEQDYPGLWRYLQEGIRRHVHESYLTSRRTPWCSQEDRPPPPFLCTYMGRNGNGRKPFRFLWNKSRATAHNVYLLLYPKGVLEEILEHDPILQESIFAALQSLDTSSITSGGRVYGGGLFKMEPRELATVPADFLLPILGKDPRRHFLRQGELFEFLADAE